MKLQCVFIQSIFIKSFKTRLEADICATGIQLWLVDRGFDPDIVTIKEEVVS